MNIFNYEDDYENDLLWTNEVLDELDFSLSQETRIAKVKHKHNYSESGYLLIDVWSSKKYQSGLCYTNFELILEVLSNRRDDFEAEWVLSYDGEEIGRFKSNTNIIYKKENKYVYSVHEDIEKLTRQIMQSIDEYIEKLKIEEQKEELVNIADELIEYYNNNEDIFTEKDTIKIVKYIMDKFDISKEDL